MNKLFSSLRSRFPKDFIDRTILFFRKLISVFTIPAVKAVFLSIALIFSAMYFITQYKELLEAIGSLKFNLSLILLATGLIIATVFLGTLTWWSLLSFFGFKNEWRRSAKAYANSAVAKYIPGYIWQFAGRAYFSNELNIPIKYIGVGLAIELITTTLIGGILAGITYLIIGLQSPELNMPVSIVTMLTTLVLLLVLLAIPTILNRLTKNRHKESIKNNKKFYFHGAIFNTLGWLLMGLAFLNILRSLGIFQVSYLFALFFHTTSFVAGTLAVPFPNGLVIRETILVLLGRDTFSEELIIISSLLFRLLILSAEVFVVLVMSITSKIKPCADTNINTPHYS